MNVLNSDHSSGDFFQKLNNINTETILSLQKNVEPYDMISLVFLLYDTPDTALQRLTVYERICMDVSDDNLNLLYDWALHAQKRPTWKYEFLEALAVCRLYSIIKQLGFNVSNVKKHYHQPESTNVNIYINPIKKVLYRLCEHITKEEFRKLKDTLISYDIKFLDHKTCELLLLELMCQKFIKVTEYEKQKCEHTQSSDTKNLAKILEYFSNLKKFSLQLQEIENQINNVRCVTNCKDSNVNQTNIESNVKKEDLQNSDMDEIFEELNALCITDDLIENLKADKQFLKDTYPIKNIARIGVCCIINQEFFHLSKRNIELGLAQENLNNRYGSSKDLQVLETTMSSFNFKVIAGSNLDHKETILFIKDVIKQVLPSDSVFMLCILSHGVRGHVYAADSVKIRVSDIQNILDSDEAVTLHGIPKVMILQACQVIDDTPKPKISLVADGPNHLKKSHFLIYWATAPEYEAFRHEQGGSLFIQFLCSLLKKKGRSEQLSDIFTKVTDHVTTLCTHLEKVQVPIFESTLRKKLYLFQHSN